METPTCPSLLFPVTTGVLTTSYPRYPGDFAGCFVEDSVSAHVQAGETVEVIAAGAASEDEHGRHAQVRILRVDVPAPQGASPLFYGDGAPETLERGGLAAWAQALFFWAGLCRRIHERAPAWDRVVAHWMVPCGLAAHAAAPHLPLIVHAHSGDVALMERIPGGAALGRRLARSAAQLNFVSADLRDRFAGLTGIATGRVVRLGPSAQATAPGEDAAGRAPLRRSLGIDGPTILSAGRLVPIKGFDVLLRAVARAAADRGAGVDAPVTLVILGEGPERPRLERMAARLGVDLRLPGVVPRGSVASWMRAADVYAQPSRRLATGRTEGLPIATLEALAVGLPIVISRTGGLAELDGQPGVSVVPAEDTCAWAAALTAAVSRPEATPSRTRAGV
ncbi:MAG: glycosyltransferase [Verrucomicrobiota bacterium]